MNGAEGLIAALEEIKAIASSEQVQDIARAALAAHRASPTAAGPASPDRGMTTAREMACSFVTCTPKGKDGRHGPFCDQATAAIEADRAAQAARLTEAVREACAALAMDVAGGHWKDAEENEDDIDVAEASESVAMVLETLARRIRSLDLSTLASPEAGK